jgi:signal peptidase I
MEPLQRNERETAEQGVSAPGEIPPGEPVAAPAGTSFWLDVRVWARDIVLSVAIAAVVIIFLYQPVKVEGTSMMPRLEDQERIFVNKFFYRFGEIERGDIVVFHFPLDPSKSYVKRIVGLPGDEVEMREGVLHVNGQSVAEPYVEPSYRDRTSHPPQSVPPDHYFVLGDHRNTSNDSRTWGTVARRHIVGKAVFAYWPLSRFGVVH